MRLQNFYICNNQNGITMDLATRKYNFIKELTSIDEALLEKLEKVLKNNKKEVDWANSISKEEQIEIEKGIEQANNNELIDHEKVMKKFTKWH